MEDKTIEQVKNEIVNKRIKLVKLKEEYAEEYKRVKDLAQAISTTECQLLELENNFVLLLDKSSKNFKDEAVKLADQLKKVVEPQKPVDKLTILFLAANPKETQKLALDNEARSIGEAIRASANRDNMEFFTRWAVRSLDILQAINETEPEIIHFSGHGSEQGELAMEDEHGDMQLVSKEAIAAAISSSTEKTRLIFFNACFSEAEAQAVVENIEAAVGMRAAIGDEAAQVFAAQFYSAIGFGKNLQKAFNQAKAALLLKGIPEDNTPVLYVRKGLAAEDIVMVVSKE